MRISQGDAIAELSAAVVGVESTPLLEPVVTSALAAGTNGLDVEPLPSTTICFFPGITARCDGSPRYQRTSSLCRPISDISGLERLCETHQPRSRRGARARRARARRGPVS